MKELEVYEIMSRFDSVSSNSELIKIDREVSEVANKLNTLRAKQSKIQQQFNKEQDEVANQLDIDCPNWRRKLVKHIQES